MTGTILEGRTVADSIAVDLAGRAARLAEQGHRPALLFVSIGNSGPARLYASRLRRLSGRVGVAMTEHALPGDVPTSAFEEAIVASNEDRATDGILVQMPLPPQLGDTDLSGLISPRKDIDGITVANAGRLYLGVPGRRPPTALAMMALLQASGVSATGSKAVVIGRSNVVGHPVAELLLQQDATVTVTHRGTPDLAAETRTADVLMVGAGEPGLVRAHMVKAGAVVIDAGITVTEHGVVGDVAFDEVLPLVRAITPVPGGVGPITTAMLLHNVVESAEEGLG
ncbi:MAG TPA: bifunctional 5,10-methylenetetrahydrofolate dehydrogenase/5,10-methenyltetrahydrofolate cyclohydrolase [Chloroflexota bacterium]|nr:bifunctional 5,10-methylenetetrahydrofolate dehydrogenase/5,10-methenyltetrahydrofolate cyclohydrolase [Chloroflexota bacterium]